MNFYNEVIHVLIERKDYRNIQNSFYMFYIYIYMKMRGEKIAAEIEPAVKKKQS